MKTIWTRGGLAALGVACATWGAGCGNSNSNPDEFSRQRAEQAREDHLIGHDPSGFPVYGVDENGKPVYQRDDQK